MVEEIMSSSVARRDMMGLLDFTSKIRVEPALFTVMWRPLGRGSLSG